MLNGIDLEPLRDAQVRNTLEHFDEYVDRTALKASSGDIALPALMPLDFVLSTRDLLKQFDVGGGSPNVYPLRVFVTDESRFINCEQEVDVGTLRVCASQIVERVGPLLGEQARQEGSPMLVLLEGSFTQVP